MNGKQCFRGRAQVVVMALLSLALVTQGNAQQRAPSANTTEKLTVTGSLTLYPLVTEIARRFEGSHPGVKIDVQSGGSAKALANVRSGVSDIGMLSRALRSNDHDLFAF